MTELARTIDRIEAWIGRHAPKAFRVLPPAEAQRIEELGRRLGSKLPAELVELLSISEAGLPLRTAEPDAQWDLLPIERIVIDRNMFEDVAREGPVHASAWSMAWVPFANDGGGDWLCIDVGSGPAGRSGQILLHDPGAVRPRAIAPSLVALFAAFADGLERGEYAYEPFAGIVRA